MSGRASFMNFMRFLDVFFFCNFGLYFLKGDFIHWLNGWRFLRATSLSWLCEASNASVKQECTASLISSCEMEVKCCCKGDVCPFIGNPSDTVCQYDSMIFYIQGLFCMLHEGGCQSDLYSCLCIHLPSAEGKPWKFAGRFTRLIKKVEM